MPGAPGVLVMRYDWRRPHADDRPQLHAQSRARQPGRRDRRLDAIDRPAVATKTVRRTRTAAMSSELDPYAYRWFRAGGIDRNVARP